MVDETVWLTQAQMSVLFGTTRNKITLHIGNIFKEGEVQKNAVCKDFSHTAADGKKYNTKIYNLDVIISVGYRVKSIRGTQFRIWANKILKEYLLRGYAINQRIRRLEATVTEQGSVLAKHTEQIAFFVRTAMPPVQGVFCDGQIFDAYTFAADLIRTAKNRIILIDNYVDDSVLKMLTKRADNVSASIVTRHISDAFRLDIERHNRQYPAVEARTSDRFHDRFLILDDTVYHLGASLKDLGKKLFAFSRMEVGAEWLMEVGG